MPPEPSARARGVAKFDAELDAAPAGARRTAWPQHRLPIHPAIARPSAAGVVNVYCKQMAQYVFTMNRVGKIVPPKRQILKDISLSFFPGAKIGLLGLNGSGKSTLIRIMAGVDKDIEGEATPMPNLNIGYLPQEPQLDPNKTVQIGRAHV